MKVIYRLTSAARKATFWCGTSSMDSRLKTCLLNIAPILWNSNQTGHNKFCSPSGNAPGWYMHCSIMTNDPSFTPRSAKTGIAHHPEPKTSWTGCELCIIWRYWVNKLICCRNGFYCLKEFFIQILRFYRQLWALDGSVKNSYTMAGHWVYSYMWDGRIHFM